MKLPFEDASSDAEAVFGEAGLRNRLVQMRRMGPRKGHAFRARFLAVSVGPAARTVHIQSLDDGAAAWLKPELWVQGFFCLDQQFYAFQSRVKEVAGPAIALSWVRLMRRVVRRAHVRAPMSGDEVIGVRMRPLDGPPGPSPIRLAGILRDLSPGGSSVFVPERAARNAEDVVLHQGDAYWLAFRFSQDAPADIYVPGVLKHRRMEEGSRPGIRCGFAFDPAQAKDGNPAMIEAGLHLLEWKWRQACGRDVALPKGVIV